jgi:hypothetical protein
LNDTFLSHPVRAGAASLHSQIGWKTLWEFAFTFHLSRELALRYAQGTDIPACPMLL